MDNALWITTRRRAVTDEATEFTMNRIRTGGDGTSGDATPKVCGIAERPVARFFRPVADSAGMKVVVRVKQIPDPADRALDPESKTLVRDAKLILDESDSYGVEMALQLVDAAGEGEVHPCRWLRNNDLPVCAPPLRWARQAPR